MGSKQEASGSENRPNPRLKPFLVSLPHHERRFLQALALIIESGKAKTVDDLLKYARQAKENAAIDFLSGMANEGLPLDLAFDAMCVHFRIVAHKRNSGLLTLCTGRSVGLLLPLPPHILDTFLPLDQVCVLAPDQHHLPPHLGRFTGKICEGTRPARHEAGRLEAFVFEAFLNKDQFLFPAASADILDPRILQGEAIFIVHLRPHRDPDDIPVPLPREALHIL